MKAKMLLHNLLKAAKRLINKKVTEPATPVDDAPPAPATLVNSETPAPATLVSSELPSPAKRVYKCRVCGLPKKGHLCVNTTNIIKVEHTGYLTRSKTKIVPPTPPPPPPPPRPNILEKIREGASRVEVRTEPIGEDEYGVERVLDFRAKGRGYQVLIKWEGYEIPEWVAYSQTNCDGLLLDYLMEVGPG